MDEKKVVKISKYPSRHLRHQPQRIGLILDGGGWANVEDLCFMNRTEFAERRRAMARKSIKELIESLSSDSLQNRFFAEMCLRDQTGT